MGGCFPSEKVLAILADCDSDIPVNLPSGEMAADAAFPELVTCVMVKL
jgi:hypothetical protein